MKDKKGREVVEFIECPECKKKFDLKSSLTIHLKNAHHYSRLKIKENKLSLGNIITIRDIQKGRKFSLQSKKIDPETGEKISTLRAKKAVATMKNTFDADTGLSLWELRNFKSSNTKLTSRNENGELVTTVANRKSAIKRMVTYGEDGLTIAQRGTLKGEETKKNTFNKDGESILSEAAKRSGKTRKKLDPDTGKSIAQRASDKRIKNMQNSIDEKTGLNKLQIVARKGVKTKLNKDPEYFKKQNRKTMLKRIEEYGAEFPRVGNNEKFLLDQIEKILGIIIQRNFRLDICKFPDGYCKENNTVYEIYEPFHYTNCVKLQEDVDRMNEIQNFLKCKIVIIKESDFINRDGSNFNFDELKKFIEEGA
jgi:hypothetical protein